LIGLAGRQNLNGCVASTLSPGQNCRLSWHAIQQHSTVRFSPDKTDFQSWSYWQSKRCWHLHFAHVAMPSNSDFSYVHQIEFCQRNSRRYWPVAADRSWNNCRRSRCPSYQVHRTSACHPNWARGSVTSASCQGCLAGPRCKSCLGSFSALDLAAGRSFISVKTDCKKVHFARSSYSNQIIALADFQHQSPISTSWFSHAPVWDSSGCLVCRCRRCLGLWLFFFCCSFVSNAEHNHHLPFQYSGSSTIIIPCSFDRALDSWKVDHFWRCSAWNQQLQLELFDGCLGLSLRCEGRWIIAFLLFSTANQVAPIIPWTPDWASVRMHFEFGHSEPILESNLPVGGVSATSLDRSSS
jgi:hypothetical protein